MYPSPSPMATHIIAIPHINTTMLRHNNDVLGPIVTQRFFEVSRSISPHGRASSTLRAGTDGGMKRGGKNPHLHNVGGNERSEEEGRGERGGGL